MPISARHGSFKSDGKGIVKELGVEFGGKGEKSLAKPSSAIVFDRHVVMMEWADEVAERATRFAQKRHFMEKCQRMRAKEEQTENRDGTETEQTRPEEKNDHKMAK